MVLETPRLILREFTEDDVDNLFELNSDPEVMRYLTGGRPTPREVIRDEVIPFHLAVYGRHHRLGTWAADSVATGGRPTPREVIRDEIIPFQLAVYGRYDRLGTWAADSAATGEFLGWFHLRPGPGTDVTNLDLGYRLRRSAWHQGYATEGSRALISMGFTGLGAARVFGHTMTVNTSSRRVLEKCGMTLVRATPYEGTDVIEGAEHGEVEYALTRPDWEAIRGALGRPARGRERGYLAVEVGFQVLA